MIKIKLLNEETLEIKKSKFISYAYKIDNLNEVKTILNMINENHKKSTHIVYAYKIGPMAGKSDAGEPKGSAGSQIYNLINLKSLDNILVVVVRFYGGTKLGIGLLSRTYRASALNVLKN